MAEPSSSLTNTPKRKRGEEVILAPIEFSFDPTAPASIDDGSDSPRSRVAHKFRGLALGSASGVEVAESLRAATATTIAAGTNEARHHIPYRIGRVNVDVNVDVDDEDQDSVRKRHKPDEVMSDMPTSGAAAELETRAIPEAAAEILPDTTYRGDNAIPSDLTRGASSSANTVKPTKPRARKRRGSPPLRSKKATAAKTGTLTAPSSGNEYNDEGMDTIVDPVRAALTWREDEITMYDPNDEDDDGTGINGVGFKPTAAHAHERARMRKQQLDEYRRREEKEARAKRNQRRRGKAEATSSTAAKSPSRRVRFMDAESQSTMVRM